MHELKHKLYKQENTKNMVIQYKRTKILAKPNPKIFHLSTLKKLKAEYHLYIKTKDRLKHFVSQTPKIRF